MTFEYIINPENKVGWRKINALNGGNIWIMMQPQVILNEGEENEMVIKNHQDYIDFLDSSDEYQEEFATLLLENANTAYRSFGMTHNLYYN